MTKQFDGREGIQVLHVVSDVVNTSGGARLSFRGDSDSRGRLYRAEELIQILPDIRVFVIQLPVGLNDGRRDGVCRDKAACLRILRRAAAAARFACDRHHASRPCH